MTRSAVPIELEASQLLQEVEGASEPSIPVALTQGAPLGHPLLPHFKYIQRKPVIGDQGCIAIGDKIRYRIENPDVFFAALGYTPEVQASGLQPDEFIWDRYTRDGAAMSKHCLQMQIATYLYRHSTDFAALHGPAFEQLKASCNSGCASQHTQCSNCPMHT